MYLILKHMEWGILVNSFKVSVYKVPTLLTSTVRQVYFERKHQMNLCLL